MKAMFRTVLISCALAAPALAFAQSDNGPVTRAEVRADLVRVEQAGYNPATHDPHYPAALQAAEAKIAADQPSPESASVGGVAMTGTSQSGSQAALTDSRSIYFGH
jgi:hypothetical protein